MNLSLIRLLFIAVCILFSASFTTHYLQGGFTWINAGLGIIGGAVLSLALVAFDFLFKQFNLRTLNTATLGLFFGFLLAEAILFTLSGILGYELQGASSMPVRFAIFLVCGYIGLNMTLQATEEIRLSIPFIEFKQMSHKKKDILVDLSILSDPRIIDLASTGLLDHQLIIPRFAVKELYTLAETGDEASKSKARRCLELIKKLEAMPCLDLRYLDTDFPEIKDPMAKLIRLARFNDTHIITSDINRIQQSSIEGVHIINIHMLSNALKPITQAGESINIKIQRYGKEARQGVGYLDDGTMVVVNGGAEFIGETIKAYVLSVKHTSSGRMIFCNAAEEGSLLTEQDDQETSSDQDSHKSYLAL